MKININDIVVKNRIRKDLGDLAALAESFKRYGQITPIVINRNNALIAGGRRLEAAKLLGWQTIDAVFLDSAGELECLELEVEENLHRKDFSYDESADAAMKIYKLRNPPLFRRVLNAVTRFFRKLFRLKDK